MSQFFVNADGGGPLPPTVATQYNANSGSAVPAANILVVNGDNQTPFSDANYSDSGVESVASGNTVTYFITNRTTAQPVTTDDIKTAIITLPLGAIPSVFFFTGTVQALNITISEGATYSFSGGFRTDGATATEIGTEFADVFEEPNMVNTDIFLETDGGNSVVVSIKGIAAETINWNIELQYRRIQ